VQFKLGGLHIFLRKNSKNFKEEGGGLSIYFSFVHEKCNINIPCDQKDQAFLAVLTTNYKR